VALEKGDTALRQELDEMFGGRARTQAKAHARLDKIKRPRGGGAFLRIHIHNVGGKLLSHE